MGRRTDEPVRQACAVPYRYRKDELEICLVTTRKGHWGLPKGLVEPGDSLRVTAEKETFEEAGLVGHTTGKPLGRYRYRKWGEELVVTGYLLEVEREARDWLESELRERVWLSPAKARRRLARPEQRQLLEVALERLRDA